MLMFKFIVYAHSEARPGSDTDGFAGLKLKDPKAAISAEQIHNTIVKMELRHSGREYIGDLQPGSFNYMIIEEAFDLTAAIKEARARGLTWEPKRVCLGRWTQARRLAAEEAAKPKKDSLEDLINLFGNLGKGKDKDGSDNDNAFDTLFGAKGKRSDGQRKDFI